MKEHYDYLVVGAGMYGATFANIMQGYGYDCLVIDKRSIAGGNCATMNVAGIHQHLYGAHIFHTSDEQVWRFIASFGEFTEYQNNVKATHNNKLYSLPFNMNTFYQLFDCISPVHAKRLVDEEVRNEHILSPKNLEEQALSLVGRTIYETLIKDYTEKQWGKSCKELPADIIKRLPLRFTYDNNYFNDTHQGIPKDGYTSLILKMLDKCDLLLECDFYSKSIVEWLKLCDKIIFTGPIDEFFSYCYGKLDWRSLSFDTQILATDNYQGCAVMNFCDHSVKYTRIIEHKHFLKTSSQMTIITKEYPKAYKEGDERYYPINDNKNNCLYAKYAEEAKRLKDVRFGGRLGTYRYLDMDKVIKCAFEDAYKELTNE